MTALVTIHGTWSLHTTWWRPESLLMRAAARNGLTPYAPEPFVWSGTLGGVAGRGLDPWTSAAAALVWYLRAYPGDESPSALVHSHGLQVLALAAARGATFGAVVDVSGPVRDDLRDAYAALRRASRSWTHVYDRTDPVILQGQVGDGSLRLMLEHPDATENLDVTGRGYQHSGLFDDIAAWTELGLWARLAGASTPEFPREDAPARGTIASERLLDTHERRQPMKGQYEGRAPGAVEGGERVLLWATVIKTHDRSNHVVQCAGETFTPSAEALSAAEPTVKDLREAQTRMERWERTEEARQRESSGPAGPQAP